MIKVILNGNKKCLVSTVVYEGNALEYGEYNTVEEALAAHPDASVNIKDFTGDIDTKMNSEESVPGSE